MDGKRALTRGMQLRLGSGGSGAAKLDVWMNSCSNSAKPSRPMHKFDPDNPGGQYSLDLGSSYDNAVATELAQMARNQPDTVVWEQVTCVHAGLRCASRCRCVSRVSPPTACPPTACPPTALAVCQVQLASSHRLGHSELARQRAAAGGYAGSPHQVRSAADRAPAAHAAHHRQTPCVTPPPSVPRGRAAAVLATGTFAAAQLARTNCRRQ